MQIKKDDKFITIEDISTKALTHWKAPFTDGVDCIIPKGTILIAFNDSTSLQSSFGCLPVNKIEIENQIIPKETRDDPKYAGYSIVIKKSDIGKRLQKVD